MTKPNEQATRAEHVAALIEAVRNRELVVSEPEFNALTVVMLDAMGRIKCPSPNEFAELIETTRQPWVQTINRLLSEIARGQFPYPFKFGQSGGVDVLCIRTGHVIEHLKLVFGRLPIKSDRALKKQLKVAGVLVMAGNEPQERERMIGNKRVGHMVAVSLPALTGYGLDTTAASQAALAASKP